MSIYLCISYHNTDKNVAMSGFLSDIVQHILSEITRAWEVPHPRKSLTERFFSGPVLFGRHKRLLKEFLEFSLLEWENSKISKYNAELSCYFSSRSQMCFIESLFQSLSDIFDNQKLYHLNTFVTITENNL